MRRICRGFHGGNRISRKGEKEPSRGTSLPINAGNRIVVILPLSNSHGSYLSFTDLSQATGSVRSIMGVGPLIIWATHPSGVASTEPERSTRAPMEITTVIGGNGRQVQSGRGASHRQ